ncbi:MAG TPA: roadblock/LC7 domain-containing protein, partial [Streptosporangiaceae bacterium]
MGDAERLASPGAGTEADLGWLLDDLVSRVNQIDKALILSRDGLAIGASKGFSREDAEHLS